MIFKYVSDFNGHDAPDYYVLDLEGELLLFRNPDTFQPGITWEITRSEPHNGVLTFIMNNVNKNYWDWIPEQ